MRQLTITWGRRRDRPGRHGGLSALAACVVMIVGLAAGCGNLLDVEDNIDEVGEEALEGPGAFSARLAGTQSDFAAAFDNTVSWGGLFTDELVWGGSTRERQKADLRQVDSSNSFVANELWTPLQTAAKTSKDLANDIADGKFPGQAPAGPDSEAHARTSLLAGYSRTLLADLFCTTAFDGTGPELTAQETYALAEEFFTRAIQASQASPDTRAAALVGRARVRLQMGDESGAAADAEDVPDGFEFFTDYSSGSDREENGVFSLTWANRSWSVGPRYREMTVDDTDTPDPRVEVFDTGARSFNGGVEQWNPEKYSTRDAPIRLASWFEAQYILAEIRGGDEARDIINEIRSRHGIDEEFDPAGTASETEILEKILDERSRTLFLEALRTPDLRRFLQKFGIDRFPSGPGFGDQTCFPLPDLERNNNPDI